MREVQEARAPGTVPLWIHPEWEREHPQVMQATTGRGEEAAPFDLGLFGAAEVGPVMVRWRALRGAVGAGTAVHAGQVHGAELLVHDVGLPSGLLVADAADGHLTRTPGRMLAVTIADCVPVFLLDVARRAGAVLHAGWRGVAAGIVERGVEALRSRYGSEPGDLLLHAGPSICGSCYEVGPEVHRALRPGAEVPGEPAPIDLRGVIAERAAAGGVERDAMTRSAHCTRCGPGSFFSHRGGDPQRQVGVLMFR